MTARKGYKCRHCNQMQTRHREAEIGDVFHCKDGKVGVFRKPAKSKRLHNSFSEGEVGLMADIFDTLHSEDIVASRGFGRHPDMPNLARKVGTMKAKVVNRQLEST